MDAGKESPLSEKKRSCNYCHTVESSRNKLFKHLEQCEKARPYRESDDHPTENDVSTNNQEETHEQGYHAQDQPPRRVRDAPFMENSEKSLLSSYTYLRIKAHASPESQSMEICLDPGTGRTLIGRSFLNTLEHTIEERKGKVKGVGKKKVHCTNWATFTLYVPGTEVDGEQTFVKMVKQGWVLEDELEPNVLIGNDLLKPYGATISYPDGTVTFETLNGWKVPFEVEYRARPCTRKVTLAQRVTLAPGQTAVLPANYVSLPDDRSFMFQAHHKLAVCSAVTAATPPSVIVKNTSNSNQVIEKGTRMGSIHECTDSGYYAATWNGVLKAVALASVIATVPTASAAPLGENLEIPTDAALPDVVSMSAGFTLTPALTALATDSVPNDNKTDIASAMDKPSGNTDTPLTDAVYNMIQETQAQEHDNKPKVAERMSTLGIKKPNNLPEIQTEQGHHVYNEDPQFASEIIRIIDEGPTNEDSPCGRMAEQEIEQPSIPSELER
ncbi:hypothetical protein F5X96DRAFT_683273 [Biscogniauxia mediterranea]|nr:hypothetical protein F5X96DRAFT_683273 [Biscogniauxia mediterranea]